MGYIYILTNPSFEEYVKIGYADDVKKRLAQLNRSECTPFAFRVYATYEVNTRLTDMKIHNVIDRLNPDLRSIDNVNGKKRVREFYGISPEDAFALFQAIAEINGCEDKLVLWKETAEEKAQAIEAAEISQEYKERMSVFTFSACKIKFGEQIEFCYQNSKHNGERFTVIDDKHVEFNGESWSLSALAKYLLDAPYRVAGPKYFKFQGEWLNDIRLRFDL